eukprot:3793823-Amphidinium_carterae.1
MTFPTIFDQFLCFGCLCSVLASLNHAVEVHVPWPNMQSLMDVAGFKKSSARGPTVYHAASTSYGQRTKATRQE